MLRGTPIQGWESRLMGFRGGIESGRVGRGRLWLLRRRKGRVGDVRFQYLIFAWRETGGLVRIKRGKKGTYASSNPEMASLMPSVPDASVPNGNLPDPDMLFNSETFSDSSLLY
jgi:hypothetical protein